jgi:hypothetical protein
MNKVIEFQVQANDEVIENFASDFIQRGVDAITKMTLSKSNRIFRRFRDVAPAKVNYVYESVQHLDFGRPQMNPDYFTDELAFEYLFQFCITLDLTNINLVHDLSPCEFREVYLAFSQLLLRNAEAIGKHSHKIETNCEAGIPHTLTFALMMSSPTTQPKQLITLSRES